MAMRNIVDTPAVCPYCRHLHRYGFELDVGSFVRKHLDLGDVLPWDGVHPPGVWPAEGLGVCHNCRNYIRARCWFDELRLVRVEVIDPSEEEATPDIR